jgi:hypothetical protein
LSGPCFLFQEEKATSLRYYFSGLDPRYACVFDYFPQASLMFSASTLLRPATFELFLSALEKKRRIVLDSGIIQGWITEMEYLELLDEWGGCFEWCAHYDELYAFYRSNGNYNYARDLIGDLLGPRLLYVLQGRPADGFTEAQYKAVMTVFTRATPFIGIGGLGSSCRRGQVEAVQRYLDAIYERLGPEVCQWMHLFGIGNYRLLRRYHDLFGSADSATWLCGVRGEELQPDGTRRQLSKPFNKLEILQHNVAMMLQWAEDQDALSHGEALSPLRSAARIIPTNNPYILAALPEWGVTE